MTRHEIWPVVLLLAGAAGCSGSDEDATPAAKLSASGAGSGGNGGKPATSGGTTGKGGTGASSGTGASTGGASAGNSSGGAGGRGGRKGTSGGAPGDAGTDNSGAAGDGGTAGDNGSGGTSGAGKGGAGTGGGGGMAPSDGCSSSSKPARGHYMITVGSVQRGYYLIPATAEGPVPLVLEIHGANGSGEQISGSFGIEQSLMGHAVIVAPDGVSQGGTIGWATGNDTPDIDLVKAVLAQAKQDHCIDTTRVYSIGFSWGGWMAAQVACALGPTQIKAFLSVAGGGPQATCLGPVAGMVVHGTADTVEPISNGMITRDKFRVLNGCMDTLGDSTVTGCQQYAGCNEPTLWCQHGGGHEIPQLVIDGLPKFFALVP